MSPAQDFKTPIQHFVNAQSTFQTPQIGESNAYLGDVCGTQSDGENLSCGFFRMTRGESLTGKYPYNETLIILDGTFELVDGTGNKSSAKKGDVYFFPENSMVTFSTSDEGLAFYTVQRKKK
ncbi:unnamed protein product [Clonostachys byssicola]|uniref:Ethanolamine utilization protein n=1 Tax=Clonostachys byssicola TaxID=160290 RepID=A0A9N9U292_9HYPO|nr:unnamed protein product [Clonostachys byssicola]